MDKSDVENILKIYDIRSSEITSIIGSFSKQIFIIDKKYLLRTSNEEMTAEIEKFRRILGIPSTPVIIHDGVYRETGKNIFYILLGLLPGNDLFMIYDSLTAGQVKFLGANTAGFLDKLHSIGGDAYDIGHYVPAVPHYTGSWKDGHVLYWKLLFKGLLSAETGQENKKIMDLAFSYLDDNKDVLTHQGGPKLLHNDFHPKNIIVDKDAGFHGGNIFSGIIDWECSQFGEIDFEISHLIHWCIFPSDKNICLRPFLKAFFESKPLCSNVPELQKRLTIYLIEHDINQIIWSKGKYAEHYVQRICKWLDNAVEKLFDSLNDGTGDNK